MNTFSKLSDLFIFYFGIFRHSDKVLLIRTIYPLTDATKITLAPSNADINQGENVTLQCHASHDAAMDLTFTWSLNGVLLDLENSAGPYHRVEGVSPIMFVLKRRFLRRYCSLPTNRKDGRSISSSSCLCVKVFLGKILKHECVCLDVCDL